MKTASCLVAALLASLPLAAVGQETEVPPQGTEVGQPGPAAPVTPLVRLEKSGSYFGVSLGTGKGTLYSGNSSIGINDLIGSSGQSPTTLALQLRGGWGNGDLLLGTQLNMTRTWVEDGGTSFGLQFIAVDLVATWWSQDAGVYARLGLGPSQVSTFGGNTRSNSVQGVELMAGIGLSSGGLGVGIDFTRQTYRASEAGFDSVDYVLAMLSLDTY